MLVTPGLLDEIETLRSEPKCDPNKNRARNLSRFESMLGAGKGERIMSLEQAKIASREEQADKFRRLQNNSQ